MRNAWPIHDSREYNYGGTIESIGHAVYAMKNLRYSPQYIYYDYGGHMARELREHCAHFPLEYRT